VQALARPAHHTIPRGPRHRGQPEDQSEPIALAYERLEAKQASATAKAATTLKRLRGAEVIDLPLVEIVLAGILAAAIVLALVVWFSR
jgi:hypothetical protein